MCVHELVKDACSKYKIDKGTDSILLIDKGTDTILLTILLKNLNVQSTLVISNSLISNNRLSRSDNLVPVLTQRSTNSQ